MHTLKCNPSCFCKHSLSQIIMHAHVKVVSYFRGNGDVIWPGSIKHLYSSRPYNLNIYIYIYIHAYFYSQQGRMPDTNLNHIENLDYNRLFSEKNVPNIYYLKQLYCSLQPFLYYLIMQPLKIAYLYLL